MSYTATPLLNGIDPPPESFVLPDHKMVYMSVTKAACTSMRWLVADLTGEDPSSFIGAIGGQQSRLMSIHGGRQRWRRTPELTDLDADQLARIDPSDDWFVFAVIRDPYSRLWSAWESKLLVRHVKYVDLYADQPWFPRVASSPEQVIEDWRAFVHARPWESHPEMIEDIHFQSQVRAVVPEGVNYTRIYDLRELSALFEDIHAHLEPLGLDQPLYMPRANKMPLPMTPEVLEGGVREVIEDAYADDFRVFGDRWSIDSLTMSDGWSPDAIEHAEHHAIANERIGDLRTEGRRLQAEGRRLRQQLKKSQSQLEHEQRGRRRAEQARHEAEQGRRAAEQARREAERAIMPKWRPALGRLLDSGPAHTAARSPWVRRALPDRALASARSLARNSK